MLRATCFAAVLLLGTAATLPAQSRTRDLDFGRPAADWCRDARDADACEVREETLASANAIDIDGRANGGISIRGWDRNDVHVRVRIIAHARNDAEAQALVTETRLVTTGGRIWTEGPRDSSRWDWRDREWWAASYEVQVPRAARVTADTTNGGIRVEGVRGSITAETTNGGLGFFDVGGDIRARATNGGVDIELSGERWEGTGLDVQTTNGGVRMTLPSNFSAELEARSTNGGISIDFPITVTDFNNRRDIHATLGSGGPPVRVKTTNGGVRISRR